MAEPSESADLIIQASGQSSRQRRDRGQRRGRGANRATTIRSRARRERGPCRTAPGFARVHAVRALLEGEVLEGSGSTVPRSIWLAAVERNSTVSSTRLGSCWSSIRCPAGSICRKKRGAGGSRLWWRRSKPRPPPGETGRDQASGASRRPGPESPPGGRRRPSGPRCHPLRGGCTCSAGLPTKESAAGAASLTLFIYS